MLYLRYGIKSITMDDVAKELGISKKTLYQFIVDKEDLVNKATKYYIETDRHSILNIINTFTNVIDQLIRICNHSCTFLKEINPAVIYDLRKYHSQSWKMYLDYKNSFIYDVIYHNIQKGVEQNIYRSDLKIDIISRFYTGQIEVITNPIIFPANKFKFDEICKEFLIYHIQGISTEKGMLLLKDYLESVQNTKISNELQ